MLTVRRLLVLLALLTWSTSAAAQTYTISPPPFLLAQNNSGTIINNACIWTYTAGTTTPATTYTTSTGTANSNPIRSDSAGRFTAFLSPGSAYKFVYESACTPPGHGTVLRTADNISAVPASAASVDDTGIAGESITAGQCVYLSNGDGGKTQGQWYKCDSVASYSSYAKSIGLATVNIASGSSGTVRVAGLVSGLTSLTAGTDYYAGTAGALTSTAPLNARRIGQAESATTLLVSGNPAPPTALYSPAIATPTITSPTLATSVLGPFITGCGFRATLTSGTAVTTSDVTGATNVFITPYSSSVAPGVCAFYDGAAAWTTLSSAEITVALGSLTSGLPYDIFCFNNSGVMACDAPVAWTNTTTRATALALQNGVYVKSGTTTRRYLATFQTTSTTATEDSVSNRYLWNYYNRVDGPLQRFEATASWTYGTNTIRQANAAAANQVNFVVGLSEDLVVCDLKVTGAALAGTSIAAAGIGLDSTTTFAGNQAATQVYWAVNTGGNISATYRGYPGIGKHSLMWNEDTWAGGSTITWYGTSTAVGGGATAASAISGLIGSVKR